MLRARPQWRTSARLPRELPDFDDFEAEERALDHVERHRNVVQALASSSPGLPRSELRGLWSAGRRLDGDHYEVLSPAAEALAGKYPLAATSCFGR